MFPFFGRYMHLCLPSPSLAIALRHHCLFFFQTMEISNISSPIHQVMFVKHIFSSTILRTSFNTQFPIDSCVSGSGVLYLGHCFHCLLKTYFQFCNTQAPSMASYDGNAQVYNTYHPGEVFPSFPHLLQLENQPPNISELKLVLMFLNRVLLGASWEATTPRCAPQDHTLPQVWMFWAVSNVTFLLYISCIHWIYLQYFLIFSI